MFSHPQHNNIFISVREDKIMLVPQNRAAWKLQLIYGSVLTNSDKQQELTKELNAPSSCYCHYESGRKKAQNILRVSEVSFSLKGLFYVDKQLFKGRPAGDKRFAMGVLAEAPVDQPLLQGEAMVGRSVTTAGKMWYYTAVNEIIRLPYSK